MRPQRGGHAFGHRGRLLHDRHRAEGPVVREVEIGAHEIDAARLQPLRRPTGQVATGGGRELAQEIGELGVAPRVLGEVGVDALAEVFLTDPGHQLAQSGSSLGVSDAIEVHADSVEVDHVGGDRVG